LVSEAGSVQIRSIPRGAVASLVGRRATDFELTADGILAIGAGGPVELPFARMSRIRFGWKVSPITYKGIIPVEPYVIRFWMRDEPRRSALYAIIYKPGAPRFRSFMVETAEIVFRDWPSIGVETGASWPKALPPAVLASLVGVALIPFSVGFFDAIGLVAGLVPALGAVAAAFVAHGFFRLLPRRVFNADAVAYHLLLSQERRAARRTRRGAAGGDFGPTSPQ